MGNYRVVCTKYGHPQDPYAMRCPHDDSLLRTEYATRRFRLTARPGIWRYSEWLPVSGALREMDSGPMTYKSEELASHLGLEGLYVSFNGYWPERGGDMLTCSFKELEAMPTVQRLRERGTQDALVVASAGNTGRAFSYASSLTGWPTVVVVPEGSLQSLWLPDREKGRTALVTVAGDYADAIDLAEGLTGRPGFVPEGGARNVARRDGMGTVVLDAAFVMGALPGHYYQAVGSGTGGVSAYEASLRLQADGRFGEELPRLHLAQNVPCAPLIKERDGTGYPDDCPKGMVDPVLFNRHPPYGVRGGVGDALDATGGELVGVTVREAAEARRLFEELEGIDILPAPSVAVAALVRDARQGRVEGYEMILLNITGGGEARLRAEHEARPLSPDIKTAPGCDPEELAREVRSVLKAG